MKFERVKQSLRPHDLGWAALARKNVLAGLLFMAVAVFGLWLSRNYPIGVAVRMGTGYVPRLLLWVLLGLGATIFLQGLRETNEPGAAGAVAVLRPLILVTTSLTVFGLSIERLGLVVSVLLLMATGALATRELKIVETAVAAVVLAVLSVVIFIYGLGLIISVWPEF